MADLLPAQDRIQTDPGSAPPTPEEGITLASKLGMSLKLKETPVQDYEEDSKVPEEFVVNDPEAIPNRCWGDDDESRPNLEFPLIDVAPLMRFFADKPEPGDEEATKNIIEDIGRACEDWGFCQVVNHGIPVELLDQVIKVSNEFFRLPLEEKEKYAARPGEMEGYGRLDFGAGLARNWSDALRHTIRPFPSNKDRRPLKPEAYRPLIEEYSQGLEKVLLSVWKALSVYLGLAPDTLMKGQERDDDSHLVIRLNHYPKCNEPKKVLGILKHKDLGSITILLQDEVGGLQVQKPGTTEWLDVPPNKGALLINVANQVEMMSNGRFHSVIHRALVNRNTSRLSVAAFVYPGPKSIISPLPELLQKTGQRPRFTSFLYGDYQKNLTADLKAGISPYTRYEINRN